MLILIQIVHWGSKQMYLQSLWYCSVAVLSVHCCHILFIVESVRCFFVLLYVSLFISSCVWLFKVQWNHRHDSKSTFISCGDNGSGNPRDERWFYRYSSTHRGPHSVFPRPFLLESYQHSHVDTPAPWVNYRVASFVVQLFLTGEDVHTWGKLE